MSFSFNSQIDNDSKEYTIQIKTDNYNQFRFIEDMAWDCIDGKHADNTEYPWLWDPTLLKTAKVAFDIPDVCANCPNHPSNGGSGFCNCTLGQPKITC